MTDMKTTADREVEDAVARFAAANGGRSHGGAPCLICNHPHRYEIETACVRFNELRQQWGKVDEEGNLLGTNVPWIRFVNGHLKAKYKYTGSDERPVIRHLEKHLNVRVR